MRIEGRQNQKGTTVKNGLSTSIPGELKTGDITLRIVAPSPELAIAGVGGKLQTSRVSAHTLNAVILVSFQGAGLALFPGDLDQTGLDHLRAEPLNVSAKVLVFPHHGGIPGKDAVGFAKLLCSLVQPEIVVFSIGRGRHHTPRLEIVDAVLSDLSSIHVACTQLSERCAATLPSAPPPHLTSEVALGREKNQCCAGTLVIHPSPPQPALSDHSGFISVAAPTAVCRQAVGETTKIVPKMKLRSN